MKHFHASWLLAVGQVWGRPTVNQAGSSDVVDPPAPPGSSGSLRGSEALLGFSSSNSIPKQPSTQIPSDEYETVPAQSEDAKLGLYLDLSNVKNPQPIRGETDVPTDPGPR
jgi:hypothetical protein